MKILLLLLAVGFMSCEKQVSGIATYEVQLIVESTFAIINKGSDVDNLYQDYQKELKKISTKYSKTWDYSFSGESNSSALAEEDRKAASNFDAAILEFNALVKKLDETAKGLQGGNFEDVFRFKITRLGETIKTSDKLVFEYSPN